MVEGRASKQTLIKIMTPIKVKVLLADDDPDDWQLMLEAFGENGLAHELDCVENGEELMEYLHRRGRYSKLQKTSLPQLILLDLNMPRKDGREALKEIEADPVLRRIPVVALTTSVAEEEIRRSYDLGANSYIIKPATFKSLVELVKTLCQYWFKSVELPQPTGVNTAREAIPAVDEKLATTD